MILFDRARVALSAALLTLALAACGGGGSSSPVPTSPATQAPAAKARLVAGFAGGGAGTSSNLRKVKDLAGGLQPIADFVIADSYVSYKPYAPTSIYAVAYYDPSAPMPSPLPTSVTWTVSGAAGATTSQDQVGTGLLGQQTSIGETLLTSNATIGSGALTATASNGDTVVLPYNTYRGTALDAESQYAGTKPCVTFAADGTATPGSVGDLCLVANADKTTSFTAPAGVVLVMKPIDQVTLTDATGIGSTTSIPATITSSTVPGWSWTILAKTALGSTVAFSPIEVESLGDSATAAGQTIYGFGFYATLH
jgi:hypothetical protein